MFIATTWTPEGAGLQGIGVAAKVSTIWYLVPYEIDEALDPDQWIIDNAAQIEADTPTLGQQIVVEDSVRELLDDGRGADAQQMADDIDDIADCDSLPSRLRIFKAFALVLLDEINVLRANAALPERTVTQLRAALRNKYKSLM